MELHPRVQVRVKIKRCRNELKCNLRPSHQDVPERNRKHIGHHCGHPGMSPGKRKNAHYPKKKIFSDHHCTDDRHVLDRAIARTSLYFADLIYNVHTFNHFPKDRVFCVKEIVVYKVDEKL